MVSLLYACPSQFADYDRRVRACAAQYSCGVTRLEPGALGRRTRFAVFVSPTLPTFVALRDGDVICEASGDVPAWELRRLIQHALVCSGPTLRVDANAS